jgi:hypothetical protein
MTEYEQAIVEAGIPRHEILGGYDSYAFLRGDRIERSLDPLLLTRDAFVKRYAWAIPSPAALAAIAEHSPILEVGAGCGYWAHELSKLGADIVATDLHPGGRRDGAGKPAPSGYGYRFEKLWHPVVRMGAARALRAYPGRALLLVWPCYSRPWSERVLAAYTGDVVCYVGEGEGGCTGTDRFHALLDERFEAVRGVPVPQWAGIHDALTIHRRKASPTRANDAPRIETAAPRPSEPMFLSVNPVSGPIRQVIDGERTGGTHEPRSGVPPVVVPHHPEP